MWKVDSMIVQEIGILQISQIIIWMLLNKDSLKRKNILYLYNWYKNSLLCVQLIQNINDFYLINKIFAIYLLTDPCFIWCFIIWNSPYLWPQLLLYITNFLNLCWNYKFYNLHTLHNKYKYLCNTRNFIKLCWKSIYSCWHEIISTIIKIDHKN